jgi:hypothetical protein
MLAGVAHSGDGDAEESTLCETDRMGRHAVEVGATRPSGRILPSLVESPRTIVLVEAPSHRHARGEIAKVAAGKRTPVDAGLTTTREEPGGQTDVCSMIESSMARHPSLQTCSPHVPTTHSSSGTESSPPTERVAVTSTASVKLPRRAGRGKKEKKDMTSEAAPLPFDAETAVPEGPPSDPPNQDDGASRRRHRSIMARYVFGTQLKPGERWRQRMRHVR